jgi:hypothetical protein
MLREPHQGLRYLIGLSATSVTRLGVKHVVSPAGPGGSSCGCGGTPLEAGFDRYYSIAYMYCCTVSKSYTAAEAYHSGNQVRRVPGHVVSNCVRGVGRMIRHDGIGLPVSVSASQFGQLTQVVP